jgi:hypothetical protein
LEVEMNGSIDTRVERLYQQIELVRGSGDPSRGRLCIMSFVAFLAGERHSDAPATASPVIRNFAIVVNDEMPAHLRQRLKPFAPRILGTNDGLDRQRLDILRRAAAEELLPLSGAPRPAAQAAAGAGLMAWLRARLLPQMEATLIADTVATSEVELAASAAKLIALAARRAPTPAEQERCWGKAVELLDRLCDVGAERPRPAAEPARLAWLDDLAAKSQRRRQRIQSALGRVTSLGEGEASS